MNIHRLIAVIAVLALTAGLAGCSGNTGSSEVPIPYSAELVEHPDTNDGDIIEFSGEAIGETMVRGDDAWLHLNDDAYQSSSARDDSSLKGYNSGMPVFISARLADKVEVFGDSDHQGDVVTIRGTFNAACAEHGGDMDIHADSLTRVTPGRRVVDEPANWKIALAAGLSALVLALWQIDRRMPPAWEREKTEARHRSVRIRSR